MAAASFGSCCRDLQPGGICSRQNEYETSAPNILGVPRGRRLDSARLLIAGLSAVDEVLKQRSENFDQGFGLDLGQGAKADHLPHHLEARDQ
jgi:hypothetical protein